MNPKIRLIAPPDFDFEEEIVPRGCRLEDYQAVRVPEFRIRDRFIAYTSPDSTYAVTRDLLKTARKSILIGIYDFTADYVRDLLLDAVRRGVRVSLMLDLDRLKGETEIYDELVRLGVQGVPAPSCASKHARYFRSSHEKVIVVDDEWTLVQSGNYTFNSIPRNEVDGGDPQNFDRGNRDMGVAVHNPEMAAFFTRILTSDMQLEIDASMVEGLELEEPFVPEIELEAPRPPRIPPQLFPSRPYRPRSAVRVVPVLSPDNYMQIIPPFLESARKSIRLEQQYIKAGQPHIQRLLGAIQSVRRRNPGLDVRIVLAEPIGGDDVKEQKNLDLLLGFGLELGTNIRYLSKRYFDHCHNKLIVVDDKAALVSSQNWSDSAVSENREAGLLLYAAPLARYYASIFEIDWQTGRGMLESLAEAPDMEAPQYAHVSLGDYREV